MRGFKTTFFLFLLTLIFPRIFGDQLVNELSQSRINIVADVASVLVEFAAATEVALKYGEEHPQNVPQFCCGHCDKVINLSDFTEEILMSVTVETLLSILLRNDDIAFRAKPKLKNAALIKDYFAMMKQVFLAGNAESILVFMMDACQKKEIIRFRCSECYANDWQCDTSGISNYANTTGSLLATYKKSP